MPDTNLLDPVPRSTLRAHVAERLRTAILAGDIAPGAPLADLAVRAELAPVGQRGYFGVSRAVQFTVYPAGTKASLSIARPRSPPMVPASESRRRWR